MLPNIHSFVHPSLHLHDLTNTRLLTECLISYVSFHTVVKQVLRMNSELSSRGLDVDCMNILVSIACLTSLTGPRCQQNLPRWSSIVAEVHPTTNQQEVLLQSLFVFFIIPKIGLELVGLWRACCVLFQHAILSFRPSLVVEWQCHHLLNRHRATFS